MEGDLASKNLSAEKRHRQSERRRIHNKSVKSALRTCVKKLVNAVHEKDKTAAETYMRELTKQFDTAARKGIIKLNTAARKKSRMQKLVNTLMA